MVELMPIADAQRFAFKYVNGHPANHRFGLPTVMAFGVLADVATASSFISRSTRARAPRCGPGSQHATGDIVIIQDADLEYDPAEYPEADQPIRGRPGRRRLRLAVPGGEPHRVLYFWHSVGNRFLTLAVEHVHQPEPHRHGDLLQGVPARGRSSRSLIEERPLRLRAGDHGQDRAAAGCRIYEVPISYSGRTYDEGKKIGWKDGVAAIWCIIRFNLLPPRKPRAE